MASEYLHKFVAELTGDAGPFTEDDYLSYFVNRYGEAMIFHRRPGGARVLHEDLGWKSLEVVTDNDGTPSLRTGKGPLTGVILGRGEKQWLAACWDESEPWGRDGDAVD